MSAVLGVDPGKTGALALLDGYGEIICIYDMPVAGKTVSPGLLYDIVLDLEGYGDVVAVVERVGTRPNESRSSAFNFGASYGTVLGALGRFRIEHVTPATWKRAMKLDSDKEKSRQRAIDRWPRHAADLFHRKMDGDRAEAALIALWWIESQR